MLESEDQDLSPHCEVSCLCDPGKLTGLRRRRRTFNRTAETAPKISSQRSSGDMSLEAKGDITGSCYLVNKDESSFFFIDLLI